MRLIRFLDDRAFPAADRTEAQLGVPPVVKKNERRRSGAASGPRGARLHRPAAGAGAARKRRRHAARISRQQQGQAMNSSGGKPALPQTERPATGSIDRIARMLGYMAMLGIAVLFLWLTLKVDLVIFAGVLLAVSLHRAAGDLSRLTRLPAGISLALVVLLLLAFFAAIGWFFSQAIAGQINQLSRQLPAAAEKLIDIVRGSGIGKTLTHHVHLDHAQTSPTNMARDFFGAAVNFVEVIGAILVIAFLGVYFAAEEKLYTNGLVRLVPTPRRRRAAEILHETAGALWYWMLGRLFSMTVLGVLAIVGLWLLGVPLPVALGFLVGILTFIPYLGAFVSAVPAVLLAAATRLDLAVYVIILFVGIHLTEGYLLVPLVQRRIVHLPPALTLSAQIVLGVLAGFLGLLLATPLVAASLVIIRMAYVEDLLGDRVGETTPSG
jgi:predicted PurR-regulated permease PerM